MHRFTSVVFACLTTVACAAPVPATPAPATPLPSGPTSATRTPHTPPPTTPSGPKITYSQCHVDGPYVAMTFDDGPHGTQTPRLLDMLKQRGLKATFFVCGQCVAEFPAITKRIVEEGHEIASHSWNHPNLIPMSEAAVRDQLERTHAAVKQTTGVEMKLFRPPYGNFTLRQRNWAYDAYGYKTILWDVDTLDWKHRSPAKTEAAALSQTRPGSIVLQHDIHKTTIDAMPATLDGLVAKGFKLVTVSELIAMDRPAPEKPKATPVAAPTTTADASIPKAEAEAVTGGKAPATPVPSTRP